MESVFDRAKTLDPSISMATVYRTLNLLDEMQLVDRREFKQNFARFEVNAEHHHHLVDLDTGAVIEFQNEKLERLKEEIARELGYARDPAALARQVKAAWDRGPDSWLRAPLHKLGELPVVSCLSIGPDSHAVARVSPALKRRIGRLAYVVAMLQVMRQWPRERMAISGELTNGEPFACEAAAVIVSHGALFAGP